MSISFSSHFQKKKQRVIPMPNTGTIMDVSAGHIVPGHKGQSVLVGGLVMFQCIAALPNMFKTTMNSGMVGITMLAFPKTLKHCHDAEGTMSDSRIDNLVLNSMRQYEHLGYKIPESLQGEGRMFFTTQVDYDATEVFGILKKAAKERNADKNNLIEYEILDEETGKPLVWHNPFITFWDSLSFMQAEAAETLMDEGDVGTSELNMLAMRANMGKSQIVEQMNTFPQRNGIYVLVTAHVGQSYQLDPRRPNVRTLRYLADNIKLKRVPENLSFITGNCYVITRLQPMLTNGAPEFPYNPGENEKDTDLVEINVVNMRGKFGPSNIPLSIVVSQRDGWIPYLSNYLYLKSNDRYGFVGNLQNYAFQLTPDIKVQRTNLRQKFRENYRMQVGVYHLMTMHWMITRWDEKKLPTKYHCTPEELYNEIKERGYDWDLLLNTRFFHGERNDGKDHVPYLSTMDLLKMRLGEYHPYWYPVKQKDLVGSTKKDVDTKSKTEVTDKKE